MEIISLFISLIVLSIIFLLTGFFISIILSFDIGLIFISLGIIILVFNLVYKYLDKSDTSNEYKKIDIGIVCPNCGSRLDKGSFCSTCGFKKNENYIN